jgi:Ca-activated chloride channel family protein
MARRPSATGEAPMTALRTLFAALTLAALLPVAAAGQPPAARSLAPYFVVEGGAPGVDTLPLKRTEVEATIAGVIADVRLTQVYRNEGSTPIDARYVFPVSTRAAVYALRLRVGDRVVDARIREKQQARREFDQARREGRSASLLEQKRPNVMQMAIANVLPGDEIAVDLRYTETIVPTDGSYRFVFPTVVGPRYNGAAASISAEGAGAAAQRTRTPEAHELWIAQPTLREGRKSTATFALNATIRSPLPIATVRSPSHALQVSGEGNRELRIGLPADAAHADRDVVIDYTLAGRAIDAGLLVHEGPDASYFLLLAQPPARVHAAEVVPREYVFIVDVSSSMHGFPLATTKSLLRELIGRLQPTDTFNVIPFAGGHSVLHPASVPASSVNVARAIRFLDGQTGSGGTELLPALRTALAMPAEEGRARSFVVVTDGYVTIEKEAFELVRENLGRANLFAFGIGSSVNRLLIEGLARAGKGEPLFVLNAQQAEAEAARLRTMIEQPVLTRIRVEFDGFDAYDVDPPQVPDLFAQRPIVVAGKFRGRAAGRIEIEGLAAGGAVRLPIDVERAAVRDDTPALRQLWARGRIAELGDFNRLGRDDQAVREITRLGLMHNLLTDYTSFIAVDHVLRNPGGSATPVDQPLPLPLGVSNLAVGEVPSTPEPEFALLTALAGGLVWWQRRRRQVHRG